MALDNPNSVTFKAFKLLDYMLLNVFSFFSKLNLSNTINYYSMNYDDNSLSLDSNDKLKLYCIKLESGSNKSVSITPNEFLTFCNDIRHNEDSDLMISYVKTKLQGIYVFSCSKEIIDGLASKFEVSRLAPPEILNALYHIFLLDCYELKDKRMISRYNDVKHTEEIDALYKKFPSMVSIASDNILGNYTPYQITAFKDTQKFSTMNLFSAKWEGVCNLFFSFSSKKTIKRLEMLEKSAKVGDSEYSKAYKNFKENPDNKDSLLKLRESCFLANGMFFLKNTSISSTFQDLMCVRAEERYFLLDKLIPKTLLLARDIDFDFIIDSDNISKYFRTSLARDCLAHLRDDKTSIMKVDFYGTDINNNFINYMFKANPSPHSLIFGTTGAGKSVAALKILCQIIDYDFEEGVARDLTLDRKIRYINIGYTGGKIFENIRNNDKEKNKANIISSDITKLRFNLFDFEGNRPDEFEMKFLIAFINLMLNVTGGDNSQNVLTQQEETKLIHCVNLLFEKGEFPDLSLREILINGRGVSLNERGAYDDIIDEILEITDEYGNKKYTEMTKASELPEKYNRFKRPVLADLVSIIQDGITDINNTQDEQNIYSSLKLKVESISSINIFNFFSNTDNTNIYPLYYAEFDKIKENQRDFVAIGWLLLKTWFNKDKKEAMKALNAQKKKPDSFYFIEEAHNFLKLKVFLDLIDVFAREVRKYGVHLILITQTVKDIKGDLSLLFNTKLFLFTKSFKNEAYGEIKQTNGDLTPEDKEIFDKINNLKGDNMLIFAITSNGVSAFRLPQKQEYMNLFMPYNIG